MLDSKVVEILHSRYNTLHHMQHIGSEHILPLETTLRVDQIVKVTNGPHDRAQIASHLWHELVAVVTSVAVVASPHYSEQWQHVGVVQFEPGLKLSLSICGLHENDRNIILHVCSVNLT